MTSLRARLVLLVIVLAASLSACQFTLSPTASTGRAPVNGIQMYYEIHGAGAALILIHGSRGNVNDWENQVPAFSKQYRVITLDCRGRGRSTYSAQPPLSYDLMTSDVIALMDYLKIKKANILGWSDGGVIALDLAINHPDRLIKVIAYGANYILSGVRSFLGEPDNFAKFGDQAAEDYQKLSPNPQQWDTVLADLDKMGRAEPNFTSDLLGSITVPMLILDGEKDGIIYHLHTQTMASLIPNSKLIFIPGTGHFAPYEKPEEYNKIVLDFLAP